MTGRTPSPSPALLFPAAAVAVHQLRYALAFGDHAGGALLEQGHAYLHSLVPWLALGCAVALGAFAGRLRRAWAGEDGAPPARAGLRLWLVISAGLFAVYAGQELLEGVLAHGHAGGLAGVLGDGGWWALPSALAVGALLALMLRSGQALLALVHAAARARRRRPAPAHRIPCTGARRAWRPAMAPLATAAAGRAPPAARVRRRRTSPWHCLAPPVAMDDGRAPSAVRRS